MNAEDSGDVNAEDLGGWFMKKLETETKEKVRLAEAHISLWARGEGSGEGGGC